MTNGIPALIGLTGSIVLIGIGLKTIGQIDIQGKKTINPTKMKLKKLKI